MYLLIIGVLLLAAKLLTFEPFGQLSWWWVAAPFAGAVLWWQFADSSGWTKRRQMNRMEERKRQRREKALEALGMDTARDRRARDSRDAVSRRKAAGSAAAGTGAGVGSSTQTGVSDQKRGDPTL